MMNKEEIISEQLGSIYHSKTASELSSFYNCMDEYAKQQAIAFANFIAQHNYKPHDFDTWDNGRKNTDEVYEDFTEYQRIEQQPKDK